MELFELPISFQTAATCALGLFTLGLLVIKLLRTPKNFPPEISKAFSLKFAVQALTGGGMQKAVMKLSHEIDKPLCTINLGFRKFVFANTNDAMREAWQRTGDAVTGRPHVAKIRTGGFGVLGAEGQIWKEQRRFSLTTLRDFGMGKIALEDKIREEALGVVEKFDELKGRPIDIWRTLGIAISNVICSIVFDKKYEQDDPTCDLFLTVFNTNVTTGSTRNFITSMAPFLRHLPGDPLHFHRRQKRAELVEKIIQDSIEEHRKTFDPNNIRDFIDAYLVEMENQKDREDTTFTDRQLLRLVFDLFVAGSETTATTLRWAFKYMMLNPEIQKKVHQEIDDVIGPDRSVRMSDRPSMPCTERVLMETQRFANLVVLAGHRCTQDVKVGDYFLTKDTVVISNLYKMHTNKDIWPNPLSFDPDNFVDKDGKTIRRDYLVPFALGKRSCLGESLAKMELFIFFVTFLQKFRIEVPAGQAPPDINDANIGIVRAPKNYEMCAIRRC